MYICSVRDTFSKYKLCPHCLSVCFKNHHRCWYVGVHVCWYVQMQVIHFRWMPQSLICSEFLCAQSLQAWGHHRVYLESRPLSLDAQALRVERQTYLYDVVWLQIPQLLSPLLISRKEHLYFIGRNVVVKSLMVSYLYINKTELCLWTVWPAQSKAKRKIKRCNFHAIWQGQVAMCQCVLPKWMYYPLFWYFQLRHFI